MKDFLELLVKKYGFSELIASKIMLTFYLFTFIAIGIKTTLWLFSKIKKRNIRKTTNQDLHPFFTYSEVYNYTRYYIPQYFQNITPSEGDELGKIHAAAAKSKLMKEFIDKGLLNKSPIKYFIILSDTGMGKTAFLINLYLKYKSKRNKLNQEKYNILLFPLGAPDALDRIKIISDKKNTILLLDAFDEDIKAVNDYKNRMIEILENVKDFRKIIFTCRTQFFPTKDEEPTDTNDISFGENIKHNIHKIYLSAFNDTDILKYLFKKYGFNILKLFQSYKLIQKSPSLMFRPMLLSYIDELIKERAFYNFTFEMYGTLIDNWLKREATKPAIINKYGSEKYKTDLMRFSKEMAKNLYIERDNRGGYFISIAQLKKVEFNNSINTNLLTIDDKTGRSLMTRNSIGQYKFAHKSILEYFLALEVFENPNFLCSFDFHGMDAALNFHREMLANYIRHCEGKYYLINDHKPRNLLTLLPNQIANLEQVIILNISRDGINYLAGLSNVKSIILTDSSLAIIYLIYLYICIQKKIDSSETNDVNGKTFSSNIYEYQATMRNISEIRTDLDYDCLRKIINNCQIDESTKLLFTQLMTNQRVISPISAEEIIELKTLRNHILKDKSENVLISEGILTIQKINNLSKHIPKVKLYY